MKWYKNKSSKTFLPRSTNNGLARQTKLDRYRLEQDYRTTVRWRHHDDTWMFRRQYFGALKQEQLQLFQLFVIKILDNPKNVGTI